MVNYIKYRNIFGWCYNATTAGVTYSGSSNIYVCKYITKWITFSYLYLYEVRHRTVLCSSQNMNHKYADALVCVYWSPVFTQLSFASPTQIPRVELNSTLNP